MWDSSTQLAHDPANGIPRGQRRIPSQRENVAATRCKFLAEPPGPREAPSPMPMDVRARCPAPRRIGDACGLGGRHRACGGKTNSEPSTRTRRVAGSSDLACKGCNFRGDLPASRAHTTTLRTRI